MSVVLFENSLQRLFQYRETPEVERRDALVADAFAEAVARCAQEVSDLGLRHLRIYCLPPGEGEEASHFQRARSVRARLREKGYTVTPIQARLTEQGERYFIVVGVGGQQELMLEQAERLAQKIFSNAKEQIGEMVDGYNFASIRMPGVRHAELQADPLLAEVYDLDQPWPADLELRRTRMEPDYSPLRREVERRLQDLGEQSPYLWRLDQKEQRYELLKVDKTLSNRKQRELSSQGWHL